LNRDDQTYPFRCDPYFQLWYPHAAMPDAVIDFVPGNKPRLLCPQVADYWHETAGVPDGSWREQVDVAVLDAVQFAREISRMKGPAVTIGETTTTLPPNFTAQAAFLHHLDFYRAYKTPYEIACMKQASAVAARGHVAVAAAFADGISEFELHQLYCSVTSQRETELPYPNIIGINEHGAILHYQNLRRESPEKCRSLLIDAGAAARGYAADVTRTHARGDGRFAALISAMDSLQGELCTEVAAGVDFIALNARAHEMLATVLEVHGLLRCSASTALELGVTRSFLPHGLGHLLGLQVHDAGGRLADPQGTERAPPAEDPHLRLTRSLDAGFVVTVEPGVYFIPQLLEKLRSQHRSAVAWNTVEALLPYGGIRIEDNLLVESLSCENLTRSAFAAL
jgi:Xaa-Pro dipeptidase